MKDRNRCMICVAVLTLLATFSMVGCGAKRGLPTAKPVSALGRPGECAFCGKKIERVERENLVTFDGVEYIVCDDKCAESLRQAADR